LRHLIFSHLAKSAVSVVWQRMDLTLDKKLQGFQLVAQEKVKTSENYTNNNYNNKSPAALLYTMFHTWKKGVNFGARVDKATGTCCHCLLVKVRNITMF